MIRAIIVDDEKLSLDRFARMLSQDSRIDIRGTFTFPSDSMEFAENNEFDVAFLDIEMPGMGGFELAKHILRSRPEAHIIFVTAYDSYAIDAFKMHAAGYLLKPVDPMELKGQIDFLCGLMHDDEEAPDSRLKVSCFGDFVCSAQNETITWKTLKAEELFALFIHYHGVAVPKDILIDKLWPDAEPQKAANLFRVTCTYIRNTLTEAGFENPLIRELNKYRLDISKISCDVFDFENTVNDSAKLPVSQIRDAIALYKGEYFQNMPYDWAIQRRTLLESQFKELSRISAKHYAEDGDYIRAGENLTAILAFDPYDYNTAVDYVKLKMKSGDNDGALYFYREFTDRVLRETGDEPPENFSSIISSKN